MSVASSKIASDLDLLGNSPAGGSGVSQAGEINPSVADYLALLKPRVMSLVVFTGLVGIVLAPGNIHPVIALAALLCIAVGGGAAGALNMWFESDIDAGMERTKDRPIPAGRLPRGDALGFGATLAVASVTMMGLMVNLAAAILLAVTIGFYVFVYTMWLKRRTPQNIVIGGAAGALPPMIGWAAVTGGISIESVTLFAIIFIWTPPHFWALALYREGDYSRVGVPMLPVVAGQAATRMQIILYSVVLAPLSLAPWALGFAGNNYGAAALILSTIFLGLAVRVQMLKTDLAARALFLYSLLYLALLFGFLLADPFLGVSSGLITG